jgi:hypothetical protein
MNGIPLSTVGSQARFWSRYCGNEKTAMTLQYVAVGCMAIMAGTALLHLLGEKDKDGERGRR